MPRLKRSWILLALAVGIPIAGALEARRVHGHALTEAAQRGDTTAALSLVDHGADLRARARFGETPLILAACRGDLPVVQRLIEAGADVNARARGGETALMSAAWAGQAAAMSALLRDGEQLGEVPGIGARGE